jgi:exopolysaccharide biosynthesis protein
MRGCVDALASTPCTVLYVVVDGRQPGWSSGMTLVAFARLFRRLGAARALNFDGGASSTMVVRGRVVNRPSEGSLRAVESAMLVVQNQSTDPVAVHASDVCRADRPCRV